MVSFDKLYLFLLRGSHPNTPVRVFQSCGYFGPSIEPVQATPEIHLVSSVSLAKTLASFIVSG